MLTCQRETISDVLGLLSWFHQVDVAKTGSLILFSLSIVVANTMESFGKHFDDSPSLPVTVVLPSKFCR